MSISTYKDSVDSLITNQTNQDSIPPSIVGVKLKDLADIVEQFIITVWDSTYPNGSSTGYSILSTVVYGNKIFQSLVDSNRDIPGTSSWSIIFSSQSETFTADIVLYLSSGKTFGKYINGQTISAIGKTSVDIILDATQEVIHPTYIQPTNSFTSNPNPNYQEVGTTINIILSAIFTRNNAGDQQSATFSKNSSVIFTDSTPKIGQSSVTNTYTDNNILLTLSTTSYSSLISYNQGPVLNNNLGIPDPIGRINAGTISGGSIIFQGIYPYFYGTSSSQSLSSSDIISGTKIVSPVENGFTVSSFGTGSAYLWFAVPTGSHTFTTWYRTALDNGQIGGSTNLFKSPQTLSVISSYWTTNFDFYITNYQTIAGTTTILS